MNKQRQSREMRSRVSATVECPRCGKTVLLIQETEEWVEDSSGNLNHSRYGPGVGDCCSLAFLDDDYSGRILTFTIIESSLLKDSGSSFNNDPSS